MTKTTPQEKYSCLSVQILNTTERAKYSTNYDELKVLVDSLRASVREDSVTTFDGNYSSMDELDIFIDEVASVDYRGKTYQKLNNLYQKSVKILASYDV